MLGVQRRTETILNSWVKKSRRAQVSEAWVYFPPGQGASSKIGCKDAEGTLCYLFMIFLNSSLQPEWEASQEL